jgi:hypothetical protein
MREPKAAAGTPPCGSKNDVITAVINFVFSNLAYWRDDKNRHQKTVEKHLTVQLCDFLNDIPDASELFRFSHEEPQKGQCSVDIAAKPKGELKAFLYNDSPYQPIMVFEAKRLPAPRKNREREYVTGGCEKTGGIQRFKMERHGAGHDIAAMIGYIQVNDPIYFFAVINQWITELSIPPSLDGLVWCNDEHLHSFAMTSDGTAKAESTHPRIHGQPIVLHHLWVVMHHNA